MINFEEYALLLSNNWYYHDKKDYLAIEKNSKKLLVRLGYLESNSTLAAKLISGLFQEADLDEKLGKKTIEKMKNACNELDTILERPKNSFNEIKWWKAVRNKNYLLASIYLFFDQYSKLENVLLAIRSSKKLYQAGRAHDVKDWPLVRKHVKEYWSTVFSAKPERFIEF